MIMKDGSLVALPVTITKGVVRKELCLVVGVAGGIELSPVI